MRCVPEQVQVKEDPGLGVLSLLVCSPQSTYNLEVESPLGSGPPEEAVGLPESGTIQAMWRELMGSDSEGPATLFLD